MLKLDRQERLRRRYQAQQQARGQNYQPGLHVYKDWMNGLVNAQTRLLDAGCGPAGLVKDYVGTAALVAGTDRYVTHFQEPAEITDLVESELMALPFASNSLDLVTCSWVLEHLADPATALSEVGRILKPGGHFLFITPNAWNYTVLLRRLIPNRVSKPVVRAIYARNEDFINPTYYRANTQTAIDRWMRGAGCEPVRFEHIGDPSYLAINEFFFRASIGVEAVLTRFWPRGKVHLVGLYRKAVQTDDQLNLHG